jgi:hypothetical protein
MKNYALVKKTDFADFGQNGNGLDGLNSDANSDAILTRVADSDAEIACDAEQGNATDPIKNGLSQITLETQSVEVGGIGLERATSTMSI